MLRILVILAVLARTAQAGVCLGPEEADDGMKLIEAFAKNKAKGAAVGEAFGWLCVSGDAARLKARIERACRTILDRDGDQSPCLTIAAAAGFARLGDHDLVAQLMKSSEDPIESGGGVGWTKTQLLGMTGDPRAVTAIVEMWKTAIPRAEQREKRHREMASWSGWRQRAAVALGAIGGKDEVTFLDEQARATRDKHVAKACRDAIAAIEKRLAATP